MSYDEEILEEITLLGTVLAAVAEPLSRVIDLDSVLGLVDAAPRARVG